MLLEQVADYAIREQTSRLSDEVIHHAKRAVIDWYASLLPGSIVPPATLLEEALAEDLDRGRARLATGRRATTGASPLRRACSSVASSTSARQAGFSKRSAFIAPRAKSSKRPSRRRALRFPSSQRFFPQILRTRLKPAAWF